MDRKEKKVTTTQHSSSVYTYLRISSTFGITMAMNIYILSHLLGGWLDERFGTSVLFRVILLFVAILSAFMYLWKRVVCSEKIEKDQRETAEQEFEEKRSLDERMAALRKELKR